MLFCGSPIEEFNFKGRKIYIKRDDLLHKDFSGNKARKLKYFLDNNFPNIDELISYGGTQSNLMYSLSALAKLKQWKFTYYVEQISATALSQQKGNLAMSLSNGMKIIQTNGNLNSYVANMTVSSNQLFIPQGGADQFAAYGVEQLASEIQLWAKQQKIDRLAVFLPSGTGVTALYLQKFLSDHVVYTTNCVGKPDYLISQWNSISSDIPKPVILPNLEYRFATPYQKLWSVITEINMLSGIEFDLVYDPVGWSILIDNFASINLSIIYLHCGGLLGNPSMIDRYNYLYK